MKILLTGAAGIVGTALRPYLAQACAELLLTDLAMVSDLRGNEVCMPGDLCDSTVAERLVRDVDGIVHLAGLVGPDYTFHQVLGPNIIATHHLLQAAWRHGVQRMVYASSHHVVGFLPRGSAIDHGTPPRPDSWYGLSKATGELQCSHASDAYGLDVLCIRIGYVGETVADERRLHTWCSARDLAALIKIGLSGSQTGFHIVYGVSRCPDPFFDNSHAKSLGYTPRDSSRDHLADPDIPCQSSDPTDPTQRYIGGHFAAIMSRDAGVPRGAGRETTQ